MDISTHFDNGYEINIGDFHDSEGPFILVECDDPGDRRIVVRFNNVGIPGVIGPNIEMDLTRLLNEEIHEARCLASHSINEDEN